MREITGSRLLPRRPLHAGRGDDPAGRLHPRVAARTRLERSTSSSTRRSLELSREGRHLESNVSTRGSVTAPKVILGVNGHIEDFGHFRGRLMHIFTYASMTAFSQNEFAGVMSRADQMGAACRPTRWARRSQDHHGRLSRIVIRTRFTYDPSLKVSEKRVAGIAAEQRLVSMPGSRAQERAVRISAGPGGSVPQPQPRAGLRRDRRRALFRMLRERPRHRQEHLGGHDGGRSGHRNGQSELDKFMDQPEADAGFRRSPSRGSASTP
jgi:hypothetical protein